MSWFDAALAPTPLLLPPQKCLVCKTTPCGCPPGISVIYTHSHPPVKLEAVPETLTELINGMMELMKKLCEITSYEKKDIEKCVALQAKGEHLTKEHAALEESRKSGSSVVTKNIYTSHSETVNAWHKECETHICEMISRRKNPFPVVPDPPSDE